MLEPERLGRNKATTRGNLAQDPIRRIEVSYSG